MKFKFFLNFNKILEELAFKKFINNKQTEEILLKLKIKTGKFTIQKRSYF